MCVFIKCVFVCVQVALQEGLENVQNFFQRNSCRLPLSPSLVAKELNIKVTHTHTHTHTLTRIQAMNNEMLSILKENIRVSALFSYSS